MTFDPQKFYTEQTLEKEARLQEARIDSSLGLMQEKLSVRRDALSFSKSQLEQLSSTIYDVLYSNPRDAFQMLPINTEVADGMTEYSYRTIEDLGAAAVVADGATDRPLVEADLSKFTRDVYEFGAGYTYTVGDQARSGAILDFGYVMEKARISAESIALSHNQFALVGGSGVTNGPASVTGFLNDATVGAAAIAQDWTAFTTGVELYNAVKAIIQQVNSASSGVHGATDCAMSTFCWNECQGVLLNTAGGSQTVLAALRQNYPEISFRKSESLSGAGAAGVDRIVAYERSGANVEYVASVIYDESIPIPSGFRWTVHSRGRAAGTVIRRPLSIVYGDCTIA